MDTTPDLNLKNITLENWRIFKDDASALLHMAMSFHSKGVDVTEQIFKHLKDSIVIGSEKDSQLSTEWLDVHQTLSMQYDAKNKQIDFKEKVANSIGNLPSLLFRDWKVINGEEKELLAFFMSTNPLVEKSKSTL